MKLKVYDDSQNYTATVIKLPVKQKVDGLDNIVKVTVFGNDVLVSKDSDPNDLYLFFPAESKLSPEFCKYNNLFRDSILNADNTQKGYLEDHGRIKALKIRGVISTGFVIPLGSLIDLFHFGDTHYIQSALKAGDEFNEIEGVEICKKYIPKGSVTPANGEPRSKKDKMNNKLKNLIIPNQFRFHNETSHLSKNIHLINPGDIIAITDKWHGCVSAETLIDTLEFGIVPIKDIIDKELYCKVKAFDFESDQVVYANIDKHYFKENDGEWFEIELEDGTKIEITSNNPVWLPELNCYREVKDLSVGDTLLVDN